MNDFFVLFVTSIYTFHLMVHLKIFELNVCASHTTTRSLPQNWRIYWLRVFFEKSTTSIDRKIVELECPIKEKEGGIEISKKSHPNLR